MENFFAHLNRRFHGARNGNLFIAWLAIFLISGCTSVPASKSLPETTPIISSTKTASSLSLCRDFSQIIDLQLSEEFKKSHILYINDPNGVGGVEIWVVSLNNGHERILFNNTPGTFIVSFQPDSYRFFVFDNIDGLFESDLSGKPFQSIKDTALVQDYYNRVYSHDPVNTYSPDKKHVATWTWKILMDKNETMPLMIRELDTGKNIEIVRSGPGDAILGSWSPDGKQYVFTWYKNVKGSAYSVIYSVDADGSNLVALTEHLSGVTLDRPRWSPDGKKVAVMNGLGGNDLWVLDISSKKLTHFEISPTIDANSQVIGGTSAWSPDGKWLAYISIKPHNGIVLLNTETGDSYCGKNDPNRAIEMLDWK